MSCVIALNPRETYASLAYNTAKGARQVSGNWIRTIVRTKLERPGASPGWSALEQSIQDRPGVRGETPRKKPLVILVGLSYAGCQWRLEIRFYEVTPAKP